MFLFIALLFGLAIMPMQPCAGMHRSKKTYRMSHLSRSKPNKSRRPLVRKKTGKARKNKKVKRRKPPKRRKKGAGLRFSGNISRNAIMIILVLCCLLPQIDAYSLYRCKDRKVGVLGTLDMCGIRETVYCDRPCGIRERINSKHICFPRVNHDKWGRCSYREICRIGSSPTYTEKGFRRLSSDACIEKCAEAGITVRLNETFVPQCDRGRLPSANSTEYFPGDEPDCCYIKKVFCSQVGNKCYINDVLFSRGRKNVFVSVKEGSCRRDYAHVCNPDHPTDFRHDSRRTPSDSSGDSDDHTCVDSVVCYGWADEREGESEDESGDRLIAPVIAVVGGVVTVIGAAVCTILGMSERCFGSREDVPEMSIENGGVVEICEIRTESSSEESSSESDDSESFSESDSESVEYESPHRV